ncbi:MAG: T9SS type A sorting domain-containing protein, partial [Bacteroidales bacterium]|nr:T9SS type A sorting domain-containing protein [Bacteroidales bacterium]
ALITKPAESNTRVTASFGTISDGAGNMKYAPNSNRRWVLACPDATSYELKFSKLKVKNGDKVIVYNGGTEASGIKQQYSGNYLMAACNDYSSNVANCEHGDYEGQALPAAITVNADSVLVVFTSTANSETDYGFVLDYAVKSFSKAACNDKSYSDQHLILTDKPNNATGDETYRASNVCEYTLNLKYTDQIVYVFNKFDLKQGDFVDIYNQKTPSANSKELIAHYDMNNIPTAVYTFDAPLYNIAGELSSRFIIRFASDNMLQGSGFEFEYYGQRNSINQFDETEINVYPNPATSFVNVEVTSDEVQHFNASVVDMMGKTVYVDQFNHDGGTGLYKINVNNLAKGVYFLHLNSENGKSVQKIVVR